MKSNLNIALAALLSVSCTSLAAAENSGAKSEHNIPTKSGEIIIPSAQEKEHIYDAWRYAPAVRAGDLIVFSGVPVVSVTGDKVMEDEAFEASIRYAFQTLERTLKAAGASFEDVIEIRTLHVFDSASYAGAKEDHMRTLIKVKNEFVGEPYPAWTVIGVDELFMDEAVLEIGITAYASEE